MSRGVGGWALGVLAVLLTWCGMGEAADRVELMSRFDALKANSIAAVKSGNVEMVEATVGTGTAAEKIVLVGQVQGGIAPAPAMPVVPTLPPGPPLRLGVRIWGQLWPDGPLVNLTKHKWQRNERFWLWLETAVPVQLALFQNYPEGRPASRQVSPDEQYPSTFATIMPGAPYKFPVVIQMDDDLRDEQVSIVVVRADAQVLPVNGATVVSGNAVATASATAVANAIVETQTGAVATAQATATAGVPGGAAAQAQAAAGVGPGGSQASAFAAALGGVVGPGGTLKSSAASQTKSIMAELNDRVVSKPKSKSAERMKLALWAPPLPTMPGDVDILLMGPGNVAQIELTFHKD